MKTEADFYREVLEALDAYRAETQRQQRVANSYRRDTVASLEETERFADAAVTIIAEQNEISFNAAEDMVTESLAVPA